MRNPFRIVLVHEKVTEEDREQVRWDMRRHADESRQMDIEEWNERKNGDEDADGDT